MWTSIAQTRPTANGYSMRPCHFRVAIRPLCSTQWFFLFSTSDTHGNVKIQRSRAAAVLPYCLHSARCSRWLYSQPCRAFSTTSTTWQMFWPARYSVYHLPFLFSTCSPSFWVGKITNSSWILVDCRPIRTVWIRLQTTNSLLYNSKTSNTKTSLLMLTMYITFRLVRFEFEFNVRPWSKSHSRSSWIP